LRTEDLALTWRSMPKVSLSRQIIGLLGWLALSFAAAAIGAVASAGAGAFYEQLVRPGWAPPGWLFAPVWTVLYALLGIAAWLVWRVDGFKEGRTALALFIVQLGANALWTWVFFVWHQGALAFAEIMLLWGLIVATAASFRRLDALAAVLLLPYLAWVTFASALTFSTWRLNPNLL
jgi:benzodiazapine receptor